MVNLSMFHAIVHSVMFLSLFDSSCFYLEKLIMLTVANFFKFKPLIFSLFQTFFLFQGPYDVKPFYSSKLVSS
jgi:hypothetical protein